VYDDHSEHGRPCGGVYYVLLQRQLHRDLFLGELMKTDDEVIAVVFRKWMDRCNPEPTTRESDMWEAFRAGWVARELAARTNWKDVCGNG
jgi:hypothetical protein